MYRERFQKVKDYIESHLQDELSVEQLSRVACLSKFHFHRQFRAFWGMNVSGYIKQLRLKRASYQLAYRQQDKVIDIALDNGYESSEAFSRAFKQVFGQSPTEFRKQPDWKSLNELNLTLKTIRDFDSNSNSIDIEVTLTRFPDTQIAVMEHRGPPELLGDTIRRFIRWRRDNRLPPGKSRTFNILHDDPATVDPRDFRFDLGATTNTGKTEIDSSVIMKRIPGGRCAVVRHIGPDDQIDRIIAYLYSEWICQSGEELRDFPLFFERISFFPDVPEHEMITDIYLPLR